MDRRIRVITEKTGTQYTLLFPVKPSKIKGLQGCTPVYFPNWWGGLPMPVFTFLEEYDFAGKTIIPFASHEGSGPSEIADTCPDATVLDGIAVRGSSVSGSQPDIEKWIDGLSLDIQKQNSTQRMSKKVYNNYGGMTWIR